MTFIKIRRTIWVDFFLNQEQPGVWACEGAWGDLMLLRRDNPSESQVIKMVAIIL